MLWPALHIMAILIVNMGRLPAYGSRMVLYAATAVIPYIASNYIGRFVLLGVMMNKQFLQYPIVKPLDLMLARVFLEIVSNVMVTASVIITMALLGIDVIPVDVTQAVLAWATSILLGIGAGLFFGPITMAFPMTQIVYVLLIIVIWITCGIGIDPEVLPHQYGEWFTINPVLHCVEWMRLAYYPNFHASLLNKTIPLAVAVVLLGTGLVMERVGRSFWMSMR